MAPPLLSLRDAHLRIGDKTLFEDLSLHISAGDRLTLLGRNGAGKSCLLKVLSGNIALDSGERFVVPGTRIALLEQEPALDGFADLGAYIYSGLNSTEADQNHKIAPLVDALEIETSTPCSQASGGEIRRAALARVLASAPDILLLDEPTNHLDIATIVWLESYLADLRSALVLISHDRRFLSKTAEGCLWLEQGQVMRFDGRFDDFPKWQEDWFAAEASRQHKMDRLIKAEARWAVEGISARRKRNMGRVRRLQDLRAERAAATKAQASVKMDVKQDVRSGRKVIEAAGIAKSYAGRTLFSGLDMIIERGDRLAIVGPNGAGKSTLIGCLLGSVTPDDGHIKRGTNLQPMVIDQRRSALDGDKTVAEILTGGAGDWVVSATGEKRHVSSLMRDFLFDPGHMHTPVSALSGGERNRLLLARGLTNPTNLIVLDEPTNDLDIDTLDLLVELISEYTGTLILVSHDRDFIDQVATTTLYLDGKGGTECHVGGFRERFVAPLSGVKRKPKAKPEARTSNAPKAAQKKLSYKDQRELDTLPDTIGALEDAIAALETALADPDFYQRDADAFAKTSAKLAETQEALEAAETRWLELEDRAAGLKAAGG